MTEIKALAEKTIEMAKKHGAQEVAVSCDRGRFIELQYRDQKLEKIAESASSGMGLALYVDGRYSSHRTNDLRPDAVETFVKQAVEMTRLLQEDPFRGLADPKLYEGRPSKDLDILDKSYGEVSTEERKKAALAVEAAARAVDGPIISVTSGYYDVTGESVQIHSNGFLGERESTQFWFGAEVSVEDEGGKKPEDYHWVGARHRGDLPDPEGVGKEAARRALGRIGQKKLDSQSTTIVLENRIAARLLRPLLGATTGGAIQQKRSFLIDRKGTPVASTNLTVVDDPLLSRGFASRHYDGDGISARQREIIKDGVLQEYLIDVYYGRKLDVSPTGGSTSNLTIPGGTRNRDEIIASIDNGIYVTGIIGGNSDPTAGDFSHGVAGYAIRGGEIAEPIGEMNITGSHATLWDSLVEVGNDPYAYSTMRLPTLVFENVSVSGN